MAPRSPEPVDALSARGPGPAIAGPRVRPRQLPPIPPEHHHRDVSGGWLRPTVFGAMDGLITNVSLIAGVGGGGAQAHAIAVTGLAGMVAGAFSMAAGEWISVTSQNELVNAEVALERSELVRAPEAEARELGQALARRGVDPDLAERVARQIGRNPEEALRMHAREELGVDPNELPSPSIAAGSSFVSFAVGALVPLLPFLLGAHALWIALVLAATAALAGGATVARLTHRPAVVGALRQLALGTVAAAVTFAIGHAIGGAFN